MWVKRSGITYIVFTLLFCSLILRLFYVSFGDIKEKAMTVAGGKTATVDIYTSKGIIYDRDLCALAGNQFVYYLVINPREFDKTCIQYISELTNVDVELINEKLNKESLFILSSYYKPEVVKGMYVCEGTARYPKTTVCEHLIGYLDSDGVVGLSGLEKAFNDELSKYISTTSMTYVADATRGMIPSLETTTKKESEDTLNGIITTIDKKLSLFVKQSMYEYIEKGCAVVMDCDSGEILSMCSTPSFNASNIDNYIDSDNGELINNAMVNQTVGSVFKMIVATCALQNGLDGFTYECSGAINISGRTFTCQNQKAHSNVGLKEAFAQSCNCYFIAIGQLLGFDKVVETAQLFGVDSNIKITKNLHSSAGKLPKESGSLALANLSIGQGELMVTPLEVARITAVMCNGGFLVNPSVYYGIYDNGTITSKSEYSYKSQIISSAISEKLKEMCNLCVTNGTGIKAKPKLNSAGGKTASAQTGQFDGEGKEILNTYFTGFYPADNPKYVITVFALNGKSGSETCAPVFAEICDFIAQNY